MFISHIHLSKEWLDTASKEDLNKIIICFNDGQGDHSVYTYDKIVKLLSESHLTKTTKTVSEMTVSEIIDIFYLELNLNGDGTDALFFDGEYKIIEL